jgi:ABC-type nitrate/sulfonate/bicarbonate transport system substrate-binding protein
MRALSLVGALLLTALSAAACSSSTTSGSTGTTSTVQTLNVGQVSKSIAFFPIYIAQQKGYFAAEHLNVPTPPVLGTGAKVAAALIGGSIDVGASVMTDAFSLYKAGQHPELIADLVNSYYIDITIGANFSGPADTAPLTQRIRALAGKKIGITGPGSGTEALVDYLFHLAGLNPSTQVTLVSLGASSTSAVNALKTHLVDAVSLAQPVGQLAEALKIGHIYISPSRGDVPQIVGASNGVVFTTAAQVVSKKSAIKGFVAAIAKAETFFHTQPAATLAQMLVAYESGAMKTKTATALISVLKSEISATPAFNQAGYQAEVTLNVQGGLITQAPTFDQIVDTSLITSAIGS